MEPHLLAMLVIVAVAAGCHALLTVRIRRALAALPELRVDRPVAEVAARLGLQVEDGRPGWRLTGRVDGTPVEIAGAAPDLLGPDQHTLQVATRVPSDVVLEPRRPRRASPAWTGDDRFDDDVLASGPLVEVLSRLPASSRACVRAVVGRGAALREGRLTWIRPGLRPDPDELVPLVRALVEAAVALDRPGSAVVALIRLARTDPLPRSRARALSALAVEAPELADELAAGILVGVGVDLDDEAAVALRATCPDADLAVAAALRLARSGTPRCLADLHTGERRHPDIAMFRAAISAVRARAGDEGGSLALIGDDAVGRLSPVDARVGALSEERAP